MSSQNDRSCQGCLVFVDIILIPLQYGSVPSRHELCQFLCPGSRNPVFCPVVRFFKMYIFGIYILWGVSWCKNFPGPILSGIRFCPKLIIFRHFFIFVTYVHPKWLETKVFYVPDFSRMLESGFWVNCPVFEKVYIWTLHVTTNFVWDPVLP